MPIVSGRQLLTWLDGRNNSAFSAMSWNGTTLNFTVSVGSGANGLQVMLPFHSTDGPLGSLTFGGNPVAYTQKNIKGVSYAVFTAQSGAYIANYAADTTAPTVTLVTPANGATGISTGTMVTATFSEPMNAGTINGTTFELRAPGNVLVPATVTYDPDNNKAILSPTAPLALNTIYSAKVKGGGTGVADATGNPLAADYHLVVYNSDPYLPVQYLG